MFSLYCDRRLYRDQRWTNAPSIVLALALLMLNVGCESHASPPFDQPAVDLPQQSASDDPSIDRTVAKLNEEKKAAEDDTHPFPRRIPIPEFPADATWLNCSGPLFKKDLRGKFVVLDFWTYCCINCLHILPELKKLEHAYPNNLIVIGVHSAKFETEKDAKNISEAILRYEIEHPVVVDSDHKIWRSYGVTSWPTVLLIDPQGNYVGKKNGEVKFEELDEALKRALPYYRKNNLLNEVPLNFNKLADTQEPTPLHFPGKVLADPAGDRLFIADSNHNRIVITTLAGKLLKIVGAGTIGRADGDYARAQFHHPQGMALTGDTLYVADTENHMLRKIDLKNEKVTTVAGTGSQGQSGWPGLENMRAGAAPRRRWVGKPLLTALNSPWALWVHEKMLYIAMAGPHQIWRMPLVENEIGPYAGNGREDIVDGALLPSRPYDMGRDPDITGNPQHQLYSAFAQPSGLASDGKWLFVADSEGSSIRAVPLNSRDKVQTVIGTAGRPQGRLFDFGDIDGPRDKARLQHALGVVYQQGKIYVADTYNNKIKVVDAKTGAVKTLAGSGQAGNSDDEPSFDEPAGITVAHGKLYVADTNNHLIRIVDIATGRVSTLEIAGLAPPQPPKKVKTPSFIGAKLVNVPSAEVKPQAGKIVLTVNLQIPQGWKINDLAPMSYAVKISGESNLTDNNPVDHEKISAELISLNKPAATFNIDLPVKGSGSETIKVGVNYYYCQTGDVGICKMGSVVFHVPLVISETGKPAAVQLNHRVSK